ncbi:MAG: B12-binding domain-containing radical SAM protein [Proteobacteria bacterium]|nr:B12-binding domain-containing radical SAM protein [Desulfobulbaceae bacterium]MBU4151423.1 B12-binding domain-containing radical SAM protein [Pseudomonadota bacterium]MDP2105342.1 radical SAM protein [Desulfobulbaceae bacterium]
MDYQGTVIRPPSEAGSIILQVTVGCSHNRCTFCGAYQDESFRYKNPAIIASDLDYAAKYYPRNNRLFLADGDVLTIPQHRLVALMGAIKGKLPSVRRVRLYGNGKSIRSKSLADLLKLRELGLDRIYMGLESGDDGVLSAIKKGNTSKQLIDAVQKVREAGIFLSVTVLLGIAGVDGSAQHAIATAQVLNQMAPNQIAALTVMPIPGTSLANDIAHGRFQLPDELIMLQELKTMVSHITLNKVQFQSNHASNFLPIDCRLSRDKEAVLTRIDQALTGEIPLMPDYMRAL